MHIKARIMSIIPVPYQQPLKFGNGEGFVWKGKDVFGPEKMEYHALNLPFPKLE